MKHWICGAVVAAGTLTASAVAADTISHAFTIGGAVANPTVHDAASLAALPRETRVVGEDTYGGVSLWGLLEAAEPIFDPEIKQDLLRRVVLATATDGYQAAYSMGELHPTFGGVGLPHIVADSWNDGSLGDRGFARLVSPDDNRRGRFVANLVSLEVVDLTQTGIEAPGGIPESFMMSGGVAEQGLVTAADLAGLDQVTREVTFLHGGSPVTNTFTGVGLWDFLDSRGVLSDPDIHNDLLGKALIAIGSDGYQIAYSLGELLPRFGDPDELAMLALTDGDDGFARLVFPGDMRGGRSTQNLIELRIVDIAPTVAPVPLPAAGVLYGAGALALFGLGRATRRRPRA